MKKKMNRTLIEIVVCAFLLVSLTGCWGSRELDELVIVIGLGVDKDKNPGDIKLTAQIVKTGEMEKTSQGGGGAGESKAYWNVNSTDKTVFDAIRNITHMTGNRLFVSHAQILVFGKDIASEDIRKHIDFFLRAHEMRPTTLILVAEKTASEIMEAEPETEQLPAANIQKIVKAYNFTSQLYEVNLQDFASRLMTNTTAPVAPLVGIASGEEKKTAHVSGMAVFKNGRLAGTLTRDETRGLLWVLGKIKGSIIDVSVQNGEKAVLEIIKAKSRVTPEVDNGKVSFHIQVGVETSLSEQTGAENIATHAMFEKLEEAQADVIKKEITAAFDKSKALNSDIFGFGDMVHKKYRSEWKEMEPSWDKIYPSIELNIDVKAQIRKTDLLTKPAVPEKETGQ